MHDMKRRLLFLLSLIVLSPLLFAAPRTMRIDYYHGGNSREEWFTLDRTVLEPLEWPGNPAKAIDGSQLGNFVFEVREKGSGTLLYSRGFNSVFGEWRDTEEAQHANRTFSESLRFPAPSAPVEVLLKERNPKDPTVGGFHEVWKTVVDPGDKFVDRSRPPSPGALITLQKMGDPAGKVDLLVLGDGYTLPERNLKAMRAALWKGCLPHRPSKNTETISTSGDYVRPRTNPACRVRRVEFIVVRPWALLMIPSTASVTCSPWKTAPCAT